jgi:ferredoxin
MRVTLDPTKCQGYGACAETCPSVFETDEFGFAALRNGGVVPEGDERAAARAIGGCPEHAIALDR